MTEKDTKLHAAYALQGPDANRALYDDWAATYDTDFATAMDYVIHLRVAEQFAAAKGQGPVLDIGAGTGLLGVALHALGVGPIDGTDISVGMLEAAAKKSVYRRLFSGDLTDRLPVPDGHYLGAVSSGTYTLGHLGPETLDEVLRVVAPDGLIVLSINARHYDEAGFAAKLESMSGQIRDLSLPKVPIYGAKSTGEHATDTAFVATFRKR